MSQMKMTSSKWNKTEEFKGLVILDPDGWNRQDYRYSWYEEEITREEFLSRTKGSTVLCWDIYKEKED